MKRLISVCLILGPLWLLIVALGLTEHRIRVEITRQENPPVPAGELYFLPGCGPLERARELEDAA